MLIGFFVDWLCFRRMIDLETEVFGSLSSVYGQMAIWLSIDGGALIVPCALHFSTFQAILRKPSPLTKQPQM